MSEHRNVERTRTFLKGRIEYNNGLASLECLVRDMSDTGARLTVSESVTLPHQFRLFIAKNNRWIDVETRWRRGDAIGVHFAPGDVLPAPGADDLARMHELEAEVKKLRRLLEDIRNDPSRIHLLLDKAV